MEDIEAIQKDSKKLNILDASIVEFSKGYDNASTLAIIKAAGVSKGLLFHYFGTKKELYLQTFDYAVELATSEFFNLINTENKDVLERLCQVVLLKMDLLQKYPGIADFVNNAYYEENEEIRSEIKARRSELAGDVYTRLLNGIDTALFREDIDYKTAIEVILFTLDGFADKVSKTHKTVQEHYRDYGDYVEELNRYVVLFRKSFYR